MSFHRHRVTALIVLMSVMGMLLAACGGSSGTEGTPSGAASAAPGAASTAASPAASLGAETSAAASALASDAAGTEASTAASAGASAGAEASTDATSTSGAVSLSLPAECTSVELSYWNPFTGPDQPFMQTLVDNFNQANPNISVTMTAQAEYNTQLGTAAASDTLPDVAIINEDQVATQAFRNVLRPMDDVVAQIGLSESDFPAVAWNAGRVADRQYAVPLSFVVMTMFYNNDLLQAAGLTAPPTNAEEFDRAAQAMTTGDNNGFMITTGFPVQQIFQQLLHQYGGTEFSEDGTQATWNSDAGVQALTWMRDAQSKYSQPNLEVDAELNAFKAGTVGMIWNGIWQAPNVTGEAVEFDGQLAAPPQIGPNPAVWAGGPLLALPVHQSGNDACKDAAAGIFIRYLIDNSAQWAQGGNVPAYNAARQDPTFTALPQAALADVVANPIFPPSIPGVGDAFAPLGEAVAAVLAGTTTDVKAALDDAANRANQVLEQNRQNYGDAPPQ